MDLITCYQLTIFLLSMQHIFKVNADLPLSADNQKSQLLVSDNEFDHLASPVISTLTVDTATQLSTPTMHKVEQGSVPAGIYLRISQKGVDYIMDLAAQALPQLLEKSEMPTIEQPQIKISHLTIDKFSQPTLKAKFIPNTGIEAQMFLPQIMLTAVYDASTFFVSHKGKLKADMQNFSVAMEIHISRNETEKVNIIKTPVCNASSDRVRIVFAGEMSTYLNLLRSVIEESVSDVLGNELCGIAIKVAQFLEEQKRQILMTTPVPISTSTTPSPTHLLYFGDSVHWSFQEKPTESAENANALYETSEESDIAEEDLAAKFAADLCADDRADGTVITYDEDDKYTKTKRHVNFDSTPEIQSFDSLIKDGFWAPDLTLIYSPKFSDQDVIFGLDAGAVLYGRKASNVNRPDMLNVSAFGDQMFGIIISEYVPNTFFAHVYDERVPIIRETLRAQNLPRFIKPVAKFLCGRCELQLIANLTRRPYITINKNGVKMDIQVDLAIRFLAKTKQHVIVNGNAALDITVRPYLKHSRLYGDVALTSVDIKLKEMGIGGIFANSVRKAFNAIIPKKLWPAIKKRLRFAFNQRGIRLPVMCGVELEKPSLSYIHHAIVIDTDFSYDLQRFVRKFKSYIHAEVARARKKELMENEEDY